MKYAIVGRLFVLTMWLAARGVGSSAAAVTPVPDDPLAGNGDVNRTLLPYRQLFSNAAPRAPIDALSLFWNLRCSRAQLTERKRLAARSPERQGTWRAHVRISLKTDPVAPISSPIVFFFTLGPTTASGTRR